MATSIQNISEDVILAICSEYLSIADVRAAAAASQEFRAIFRPLLYQSMLWVTSRYERIVAPPYDNRYEIIGYLDDEDNPIPLDDDEDHPPPDSRTRVSNAHLFFSLLQGNRALAERVQRLGLCADCLECQSFQHFQAPPHLRVPKCTFVNQPLLASMTALRALELGPQWHEALFRLPVLPRLDTLILTGGSIDLSTIAEYLAQPALQFLRLRNLGIGLFNMLHVPRLAPKQISPVDNLNSKVTDLSLEAVDIDPDAFVYLLRMLGDLRTLAITISCVRQWRAICQINGWDHLGSTNPAGDDVVARLGYALQHVKHSLQCLRLWYDHRAQTKKARLRDQSLLPSFAGFTKLKILEVDPAMLVGCRRCQIMSSTVPQCRPVSEFARLLPAALEELTLSIDFEQTERLPDYRSDLAHSIISENGRLENLAQLTWFDDKVLASNRCCANNWYRAPRGHFPYDCYPIRKPRWTSQPEQDIYYRLARQLLHAGVDSRSMDFWDQDWWLSAHRFPIPPLQRRLDRYREYGYVDAGQF